MKFKTLLFVIILLLAATLAYAGPFDAVKSWLLDNALYAGIGVILGIGVVAIWTDWICLMLVGLGGLFTTVGLAFSDRKLDKTEVANIKAQFAALRDTVKNLPRRK